MCEQDTKRLIRVMIADYIHNSQATEGETTAYTKRRWDLLITMGSVRYSILAGLVFSLLLKGVLLFFFSFPLLTLTDKALTALFTITAAFLFLCVGVAEKKVLQEHAVFSYILIQERTRRARRDVNQLINSLIGFPHP
jgi:hypothetical protein